MTCRPTAQAISLATVYTTQRITHRKCVTNNMF